MIDSRQKRGLEQCISGGRCRFVSYAKFGREFELGDHARVWANKKLLDEVATACKEDPEIQLDLTWVLLPRLPDRRWMLDRNESPRYPSLRMFRQDEPATWAPVARRVPQAFYKLTSG